MKKTTKTRSVILLSSIFTAACVPPESIIEEKVASNSIAPKIVSWKHSKAIAPREHRVYASTSFGGLNLSYADVGITRALGAGATFEATYDGASYATIAGTSNTETYSPNTSNNFKNTKDEATSTISIDVDTASYANVRRYLNGNQLPPEDAPSCSDSTATKYPLVHSCGSMSASYAVAGGAESPSELKAHRAPEETTALFEGRTIAI
jgi:hypothetical protein